MCKKCACSIGIGNQELINIALSLGVFGTVTMIGHLSKYEGGTYLDMSIDQYGIGSNPIRQVCRIKYCPECGRQL